MKQNIGEERLREGESRRSGRSLRPSLRHLMIIALALAVLFAPATTVDVPLADVELRLQGAVAPADALLPFVLGGIAGGTIATTAWRYVTGVSFVEALSGDLYSDCEDVELKGDDEIQGMLYGSSYLLADNDSVTLAMANNRLGDSRNPAMAKVKLKIAEGINQGKTKAEIQNDVQAVVDSHYATIEHNLYTQLSTELGTMGRLDAAYENVSNRTGYYVRVEMDGGDLLLQSDLDHEETHSFWTPSTEIYLRERQATLLDGSSLTVWDTPTVDNQQSFTQVGWTVGLMPIMKGGDPPSSGDLYLGITYLDEPLKRGFYVGSDITYDYNPSVSLGKLSDGVVYIEKQNSNGDNNYPAGDKVIRSAKLYVSRPTGEKDLNGDPLYEEKPVLDMMRWTRTIEEIGQAHTQMSDNARELANTSYDAYQAGELDVSDLYDPYVLAGEMSSDYETTGYWAYLAAELALTGMNSSLGSEMTIYLPGQDAYDQGLLFTNHNFSETDGVLQVGYEYHPTGWSTDAVWVSDEGLWLIQEPFVITEARSRTGESLSLVSYESYNYQTANSTSMQEELDQLAALLDYYESIVVPSDGTVGGTAASGTTWGDLFTWPVLALVGGVAAFWVWAANRRKEGAG